MAILGQPPNAWLRVKGRWLQVLKARNQREHFKRELESRIGYFEFLNKHYLPGTLFSPVSSSNRYLGIENPTANAPFGVIWMERLAQIVLRVVRNSG